MTPGFSGSCGFPPAAFRYDPSDRAVAMHAFRTMRPCFVADVMVERFVHVIKLLETWMVQVVAGTPVIVRWPFR